MVFFQFSEKLVDKENNEVKFDIIPTTNDEYIPLTYGCIRFFDGYRFLSSSLSWSFETLIDNNPKTPRKMKERSVGDDTVLNIVNELETIVTQQRFNIDFFEDLKKDLPNEIDELKETLINFTSTIDL